MNSKVLTNEHEVELGNGIKLYYGAKDESNPSVIRIIVKGKFTPTIERKDYQTYIRAAKETFSHHGNMCISKLDWIEEHYIFTTDFTECGISYNKSFKWKFQLYITPKVIDNLENFRLHITKLGEAMLDIMENYLELNGFELGQ